ncbi:MAG: guanylate kinase [Actinobacteria bacterium]|uniref:guanylate kinase n=2 Tax=freshwater metagenome TaxID=449393 RepID=A0A6J7P2Q7_9ZZZZ|nr:guanylate kinase [Actinomycetota bacterium]MSY48636.1 guanylate kinase [Actinomycetota bacterium]MTH91509.1 guanylate kinase [Actinomycetota bacterium]
MGAPPQLTPQQRAMALDKAAQSRKRRAEVKNKIKSGEFSIDTVLEIAANEESVGRMRVRELLEALSGVGKVRATSLMERLNISPTRRIQGLGRHQLKQLRHEFMKSTHAVEPGKLLVLSGPGGVGKSTVASTLRASGDFWVSVSATTRSPRGNEHDGVDYFFISDEEFSRRIKDDEFLEWAQFAGSRYGTPRSAVEEALLKGRNVLLEIEIDGARQVKAHLPQSLLVFLEPPSWEELVSRLEGRGTDGPERRAERLALAQEELAAASFFDIVIVNDQVERVVQQLIGLIS